MRPNSRGMLGSSAGLPPGTGMRPGSGRRAPGTARLRTGVQPSGPGTQAAQGLALSASINVSDRPVTGQGMKGMQAQVFLITSIHSTSYFPPVHDTVHLFGKLSRE